MIKHIAISGLGPHLDFSAELDPRGLNTLSGPSESGKTFLVEAVMFALYGASRAGKFQPEAIHDDAEKAVVEITMDSGRTVRRTVTRTRSQSRSISLAGDSQSFSSEKAFAAALGDITEHADAVQLVMVPMTWQGLAAGNARKLRDLLSTVLPGGDVDAEVAKLMSDGGHVLEPTEIGISEKDVMARRRTARKDRDEAEGRRQAASERVVALRSEEDEVPDPPDAGLLDRIEKWEAHDALAGNIEARKAKELARQDWDRRRTELGDEPVYDPAHDMAFERHAGAQAAVNAAMQAYQEVYGRHQMLASQLQPFASGQDPSVCPMCARPGWEQGAQWFQQAQAQGAAVHQELQEAQNTWNEANQGLEAANQAVEKARAAKAEVDAWHGAIKALGPRPELPDLPDDAPEPPDVPRPTDDEVASAQAYEHALASAQGARARREKDLAVQEAVVERETKRHDEASKKADRLDVLLDAVRAAPSIVAERSVLALGPMGPVTLKFGDNPAVTVLIDGRPWWLASRGRQVVADMAFRAAIRRALDMAFLPIFVDNVQDVGGQPLPDVEPPLVLMRTTDGDALKVKRGA